MEDRRDVGGRSRSRSVRFVGVVRWWRVVGGGVLYWVWDRVETKKAIYQGDGGGFGSKWVISNPRRLDKFEFSFGPQAK
jgi:hypothetical protein